LFYEIIYRIFDVTKLYQMKLELATMADYIKNQQEKEAMRFEILTSHTASGLNRMIESYLLDGWSVVGSHQVAVVHEHNRFAGTQHKDTIIEREYSISMSMKKE
jgi:hypothetical protein